MDQLEGGALIHICSMHSSIAQHFSELLANRADGFNASWPRNDFEHLYEEARLVRDQAAAAKMAVSHQKSIELCGWFEKVGRENMGRDPVSFDRFKVQEAQRFIIELVGRIADELRMRTVLIVDPFDAEMYRDPMAKFDPDFAAKFSGVVYDVTEAAKCLGLDRSTAAAFHSLRCLEGGIRALSRCLGISDPTRAADRTWGKVLGVLKHEMDRRWPPNLVRTGGDDELFENAYAALAGMQNPWRNSTMRLDQKYTPEEVEKYF
jgi:hypothetical protein